MTNADEPRIDDHPDEGLEEFERTGREDADLADVDEDENPLPADPGPDPGPEAGAAPVTSPPEDSR